MVKNNHYKPNKWTFVTWVDKSLDQSLSRKNVNNGFRGTTTNISNEDNESFDGLANDIQWGEDGSTT